MLGAALLAGVPPVGLGAYAWQGSIPPGRWDFLAVSDRSPSVIVEARNAGIPVWAFAGPDAWTAATWRATLARQIELVERAGLVGIVANPEAGWERADAAELDAFGRALRDAAARVRVGVVTVPSWRGVERVSRAAGAGVWWSIELYAHSTPPDRFAGWVERWEAAGIPRTRLVPSIAGFVPPSDLGRQWMASAETYAAYLAALPNASGAIVWGNNATLRSRAFMLPAMASRWSLLRTAPFALASFLTSRAAAIVAAAAALAVLAFVLAPKVL